MSRRRELPRILTAVRCGAHGVTSARIRTELRRGNWQRLARGIVLTDAHPPSREDWAETGILLGGEGAGLSGWDALGHYDLPAGPVPRRPVLVLTTGGGLRTVGGVHLRPTARPFPTRYAAGRRLIRLAPPARAVADAALWSDDARWVRALITSSVQRRRCTVPDLLSEYDNGPRNGSHLLRLALADASAGAKSVAEADALHAMTDARVPPFELNVPVHNEFGQLVFEVDVLWRSLRAVLEVDSREYHLGEAERLATMAKHNALTGRGIALIHDAPSVIRQPDWAAGVDAFVRHRARELGVPLPRGCGAIPPPLGGSAPPLVLAGLRPGTRR